MTWQRSVRRWPASRCTSLHHTRGESSQLSPKGNIVNQIFHVPLIDLVLNQIGVYH